MSDSKPGTTFVLVHGAWGGSYGFREVRRRMAQAQQLVYAPSLTGIGERSHLTHPGIALSTHIRDVVNVVLYEDLHDIVLVGFSYGGMVVTGALEHIGDRVSHLVYLDAFVPNDGDSVMRITGLGAKQRSDLGQEWLIPPLPRRLDDPEAQAWNDARRSGQPVGTFSEPVHLERPLEEWPFTLTYIKASADPAEDPNSPFWVAARHAQASTKWSYHEIETHHLVPLSHPQDLSDILVHVAD